MGEDGAEADESSDGSTSDDESTSTTEDDGESSESGEEESDTGDPIMDMEPDPEGCPEFEPAADDKFAPLVAGLEAFVSPSTNSGDPSGVGIAIVVDGQLTSAGGVGFQSKDGYGRSDQPVSENTHFWIASTSKFVTAVGAMAIVDADALDVQAPVTDYLPNYTEPNGLEDQIKLHHTMRMNAGLANDGGCYMFSVSESEQPTGCAAFLGGPQTVLEKMFDPANLATAPYDGSQGVFNITNQGTPGLAPWFYSNWGTMMTGRVMEVVEDASFPEIIQERVFDPAQMCTATYAPQATIDSDDFTIGSGTNGIDGFCLEPELGHDSAAPYYQDELACPGRDPNGGVRASVVDLGRLAQAVLADLDGDEVLLTQAAANQLFCPEGGTPTGSCDGRISTGGSPFGADYGYFNFSHTYAGYRVYTHGGGRAGFGSLFWMIPSEGFAISILGNVNGITTSMVSAAEYAVDCYLDDAC